MDVEIDLSAVPVFAMVPECVRNEVFGGAVDRNQAYAMSWIHVPEGAAGSAIPILYDAQTSGGLLVALPERAAEAFVEEMQGKGHEATSAIGRIMERDSAASDSRVVVINPELKRLVGICHPMDLSKKKDLPEEPAPASVSYEDIACCEDPPDFGEEGPAPLEENHRPAPAAAAEEGAGMEALAMFQGFMREANKPGRIDQRNKKLMAILLSIAHHCHPCLKIHLNGAIKMGIPKEEIDEAANLAVSFGGCTAMMFYKQVCKEVGL